MPNITITLTAEELHAFEIAKRMMDEMEYSNLAMDEEFGQDTYKQMHASLNTLEAKIDSKVQFENEIAYLREQYPNHTVAEIRKALRDHNKNNA